MVSVFFDTFYTMARRGTRRKLRRGGANPIKALGVLALLFLGGLKSADASVIGDAWNWLKTKHTEAEMDAVASQVFTGLTSLKPPSTLGLLGVNVESVDSVLTTLNQKLAGDAPDSAPVAPPTTIPATALQNDMVYRDASGKEFEVQTWSEQGQSIRLATKEGETRVIPKTEQFTFVRNPYAEELLEAEEVERDGGRRKRRYRRKTLRRKK